MDNKRIIAGHLERDDLPAVVALARHDHKVITRLIRFAYDKESLIGWRAILALGMVARELVPTDPVVLRETCRKLLWSLSDESGGIGWSAPEMLGEIVSSDPKRFADIIPLIAEVYDVEEEIFRAGILYALARIAETAPDQVDGYQRIIMQGLTDSDPLVRIRAIELVGKVLSTCGKSGRWTGEYLDRVRFIIRSMLSDHAEAWLYKGDGFISVQVKDAANDVYIF